MGYVEQIFAAAASAGLLKTAEWQPADGSAPQTQSVGFSAADTNLFDGLALGTDIREQDGEFEIEEADDLVVALPARYAITYRTLAHDISIQG